MQNELVSIVIVTHNNENEIRECLRSLLNQSYKNFEIIVVDNNSDDLTGTIIKNEFLSHSNINLVENKKNLFYAGGNNEGFKKCTGDWVVILNPDVIVDDDWLQQLLSGIKTYPGAGIFCSNVLLYNNKATINACGNEMHVSGLVFSRLYGKNECECKQEEILLPSGAAFLFNKKLVREIGQLIPFNERHFQMEFSDVDLALRALSVGKNCVMMSSSKAYHKYKFKMDAKRFQYLEKCRYRILCHLTKKTRFCMIPVFFVTELAVLSFAFKKGFFVKKLFLYFWLLKSHKLMASNNSREKDYGIISKMVPDLRVYNEFELNHSTERAIAKFNLFFKKQQQKILSKLRS